MMENETTVSSRQAGTQSGALQAPREISFASLSICSLIFHVFVFSFIFTVLTHVRTQKQIKWTFHFAGRILPWNWLVLVRVDLAEILC